MIVDLLLWYLLSAMLVYPVIGYMLFKEGNAHRVAMMYEKRKLIHGLDDKSPEVIQIAETCLLDEER